jgi:hypothetical protein
LDLRHSTVIDMGPPDILEAMFNTCGIQRPLYSNLSELARKPEEAVDLAAETCIRDELHQFLFYFLVLRSFTGRLVYSHVRSFDWYCLLLSPFMATDLWKDEARVRSSLTVVRSLAASPVSLGESTPGK